VIAVTTFDVTMRQAADLGTATFLLRQFVAGDPDDFIRRRAEALVAEYTSIGNEAGWSRPDEDLAAYDGNPLDDDGDDEMYDDELEHDDDAPLSNSPGARVLFEEGWI